MSVAYVNPVSCVGVMGPGNLLRTRYPDMYAIYRKDCSAGELRLGKMHVVYTQGTFIINFPIRHSWNDPCKLEYIEEGLVDLERVVTEAEGLSSIYLPALGCGRGRLRWGEIKPLLEDFAERVPYEVLYP